MSRVSLDLFAIFAKLGDVGSFSRAARELGLSKATVSKRVAELEAALGVALVARTTRRATLTEAGRRLYARALRMVEEADAAAEEAAEARAAPRGRLRVAAPTSFSQTYLGPLLAEFMEAYPEITLDLALADRPVDLVADGFDLAVRIGVMPDSSLTARKLAPVRLLLVGAPSYFAARGRPARPEELALHACLVYAGQQTGAGWRFAGPNGELVQVRVPERMRYDNGDVIGPILRAGQGLALQPDFVAWPDLASGALECALPDWSAGDLTLHLLSPPGRGAPRKVRAFSDFVAERFGGGKAPWLAWPTRPMMVKG